VLHQSVQSAAGNKTPLPGPGSETVARRDAGDKPTWTYLRRVSEQACLSHDGLGSGSTTPELQWLAVLALLFSLLPLNVQEFPA